MDYFFLWGEAKHYFLGMGGMQSLSSQGGMVGRLLLLVEKEVLLRREGWEVDILVTATDLWSVTLLHCYINPTLNHKLF